MTSLVRGGNVETVIFVYLNRMDLCGIRQAYNYQSANLSLETGADQIA